MKQFTQQNNNEMNFDFITKRPLWQNILIGFGMTVFILSVFLLTLNMITNHGEYLTVPEVKGKNYVEVLDDLESKGFDVVIQDSIYVDSLAPNSIIKQFPEPEATVKVNRVIYLTINCTVPPTIAMPNLIGMSFRNALLELSLEVKLTHVLNAKSAQQIRKRKDHKQLEEYRGLDELAIQQVKK